MEVRFAIAPAPVEWSEKVADCATPRGGSARRRPPDKTRWVFVKVTAAIIYRMETAAKNWLVTSRDAIFEIARARLVFRFAMF